MNPPFPSSQWGVFNGSKINYLWQIHRCLDCHFCLATCEQKHFSNAVILAMDSPNQGPMQKLVSTHRKAKNQSAVPRHHWQNMTAHEKCKVHKLRHWWHAVSRIKHCTHSAILPVISGGTAMWNDRHSVLLSSQLNRLPSLAILTQGKLQGFHIPFFKQRRKMLRNGNEIICSRLIAVKIKWHVLVSPINHDAKRRFLFPWWSLWGTVHWPNVLECRCLDQNY